VTSASENVPGIVVVPILADLRIGYAWPEKQDDESLPQGEPRAPTRVSGVVVVLAVPAISVIQALEVGELLKLVVRTMLKVDEAGVVVLPE